MTETDGVKNRTRRRAVRSEGPPPNDADAASPVADTTLPAPRAAQEAEPVAVEVIGWGDDSASDATDSATDERAASPVAETGSETADSGTEESGSATDDDTESEAPAAASAPGRSLWMHVVAAVFLVLTVASVGASGFFIHEHNQAADREAQRTEYLQFAKQAMTSITNISADSAPDDFARVLAVTSGDFAADLSNRKNDFAQLVQKAQVKTKGEVTEAALESSDDHTAIALVAVKQTLSNAGADGPQQRQYRFRVTIARGDKLTVTGMEMVL